MKKMRPLHGVILSDVVVGKKLNLGNGSFSETPFTEISCHVQGAMSFR
jgi:hypothetical protein